MHNILNDKGGSVMKINFFFAWTKNKDKNDEYTKSIGGGFKFPSLFKWLTIFKKNKDTKKNRTNSD